MQFFTAYGERLRIDSGGRVLINRTNNDAPGGNASKLQIRDTTYTASISVVRNDPGGGGPSLVFGKSRNATQSDNTLVHDGDNLGQISFFGADGNDMNSTGAMIVAQVDGTPGSNDMPGRLVFKTTADGSASSTERLRIDSTGRLMIGTTNADSIGSIDQNVVIGSTTNAEEVALTLNVMEGTNNRRAKFFLDDNDGVFGVDSTASTGVPPFVVRIASTEKFRVDSAGVLYTGNYSTTLDATAGSIQVNGGTAGGRLGFRGTTTSAYGGLGEMHGYWDTNKVASILFHAGADTSNKDDGEIRMYTRPSGGSAAERLRIDSNGHVLPGVHNTTDLGSSSVRWRNVYTTDLQLSNEGKSNDVDGTWGNYTIQEGESELFLINNRNGKKYVFLLKEVS